MYQIHTAVCVYPACFSVCTSRDLQHSAASSRVQSSGRRTCSPSRRRRRDRRSRALYIFSRQDSHALFDRRRAQSLGLAGRRPCGGQMFFERRSAVPVFVRAICFTDCPVRRAAIVGAGERGGRTDTRSATNDSLRYFGVHMLSAATDHLATRSHNDRNILNVMTTRLCLPPS